MRDLAVLSPCLFFISILDEYILNNVVYNFSLTLVLHTTSYPTFDVFRSALRTLNIASAKYDATPTKMAGHDNRVHVRAGIVVGGRKVSRHSAIHRARAIFTHATVVATVARMVATPLVSV